ncbi:MAG: RNA methyltransferase [Parasporobacterium sp.]|nr:RNA methyltransferase [Parasporobacterium sp.]
MISSKNNSKIKGIKKLLSSAKERRVRGLFVIEGIRLVKEAPPEMVEQLYLSESLFRSGTFETDFYNNMEVVSDEVFQSVSDTVTPQGALALVRQPSWSLDPSELGDGCRLLLLDDIQDPGNLGTMIRTAEAAGVTMVVMSEGCADIFNPKVIRSTMGSIFRVPFVVDDLVSVVEALKAEGVIVYGAALDDAVDLRETEKAEKLAIVIGNEGNGISKGVLNSVSGKIRIPMEGRVESLNAAVSAALLLYYFRFFS